MNFLKAAASRCGFFLYVLATLEYVASVFLGHAAERHMKRKISYRKITPKISQKKQKKSKNGAPFRIDFEMACFYLEDKRTKGF